MDVTGRDARHARAWSLRNHLSDDALAEILEHLDEAVLLVDDGGRLLAWNPAATRLGGLADGDIGRSWTAAAAAQDESEAPTEPARSSILADRTSGPAIAGTRDQDLVWSDARGNLVWVSVRVIGVTLQSQARGLVVVATDRTEARQMQIALSESHRQLVETQSLAHVGLWIWDRVADNVQWTEEMHRIHAVEPRDFAGDLAAHVASIPEPDRSDVRRQLVASADRGAEVALNYPVHAPDRDLWVATRARPMLDDSGRILGLVGTSQDVTERRHGEQLVERANQELERFARSVAHDLKSPLTVMIGMADLMAMDLDPESQNAKMVARIRSAGLNASDMITDLLTSALDRARLTNLVAVDLNEVLGSVRRMMAEELQASGFDLRSTPLPIVLGSRILLTQVFRNLVGNAVKYGRKDRDGLVQVSGSESKDGWEFRVADNGIGIPAEHRADVFTEGFRVRDEDDVPGDGVGLATCLGIVEQHLGTIEVVDGIDGGACFVVRLPKARRRASDRA